MAPHLVNRRAAQKRYTGMSADTACVFLCVLVWCLCVCMFERVLFRVCEGEHEGTQWPCYDVYVRGTQAGNRIQHRLRVLARARVLQ